MAIFSKFVDDPLLKPVDRRVRSYHWRALLAIAYPVSLGQLSHVLTGVMDSVMLGHYHPDHLAASTFAFNVFIPPLLFVIGFSMGITPQVATSTTDGLTYKSMLFKNGFWLHLFFAALLCFFLFSFQKWMYNMGQAPEIIELALLYFKWVLWSLIPITMYQFLKQYVEGMSDTQMAMILSVATNVLNIGLNYILIFGHAGFAPMGVEGAAIATFVSKIVCALGMLWYVLAVYPESRSIFNTLGLSLKKMIEIVVFSIPIGVQLTFEAGAFAVGSIMMGWISKEALSAHQIAIGLASLSYIVATGLGAAATVRTGNVLARKTYRLPGVAQTSIWMVMLWMGACAIIFAAAHDYLPYLYIGKESIDIIKMASGLIFIAAFFQLFDGIQVVCIGILRGLQDVSVPTWISLVAYWVVALPVGYVLSHYTWLEEKGIWVGFVMGLMCSSGMLFLRVRGQVRKQLLL